MVLNNCEIKNFSPLIAVVIVANGQKMITSHVRNLSLHLKINTKTAKYLKHVLVVANLYGPLLSVKAKVKIEYMVEFAEDHINFMKKKIFC
jgi:hypothetical protein